MLAPDMPAARRVAAALTDDQEMTAQPVDQQAVLSPA